jgi:hypothetical protein
VNQMAGYLRYKAPHQLVLVGWEGYFGPSTPHHQAANPPGQVSAPQLWSNKFLLCGRVHNTS